VVFDKKISQDLKDIFRLPWQREFCMEFILLKVFVQLYASDMTAKFHPSWPSGIGGEVF